jgi:hypothetical protein
MADSALPPERGYAAALAAFLRPQHTNEYWEALGEFVSTFSSVEVNMQLALWTFAGLSKPMANALLAGSTRIDSAINLMNKISVAQKWRAERKKELNAISTQLGIINKIRNDILHYGAESASQGEWIVSNKVLAATQKRIRTTKITVRALHSMTDDLVAIESRLVYLAWGSLMPAKTRRIFKRREPWRYKPPSGAVRGRKSRKSRRKPPAPPQSSRG